MASQHLKRLRLLKITIKLMRYKLKIQYQRNCHKRLIQSVRYYFKLMTICNKCDWIQNRSMIHIWQRTYVIPTRKVKFFQLMTGKSFNSRGSCKNGLNPILTLLSTSQKNNSLHRSFLRMIISLMMKLSVKTISLQLQRQDALFISKIEATISLRHIFEISSNA